MSVDRGSEPARVETADHATALPSVGRTSVCVAGEGLGKARHVRWLSTD